MIARAARASSESSDLKSSRSREVFIRPSRGLRYIAQLEITAISWGFHDFLTGMGYVMSMRTLILSDLHLGSRHTNVSLINETLDCERFDRLILNGDTINNLNFRKLNTRHWGLLERFRKIGKERDLVLIRGNHDHDWDHRPGTPLNGTLGTGHVLPALLEVPMREDYRLEIGGRAYAVLHGDRFDPTLNYPMLTDVAVFCYQFTTKLNKKLAKWLKKKSKRLGGLLEFIRGQSVAYAKQESLEGVITGHTHFAEDIIMDDIHYLNTGSWTENPCAYVTITNGSATLHHMAE
jgi:UDP-2,3-diacylglucosamine pyrophosphatase LpxH